MGGISALLMGSLFATIASEWDTLLGTADLANTNNNNSSLHVGEVFVATKIIHLFTSKTGSL